MFLLDTNVVSELRKKRKAHPNVIAWADSCTAGRLYLSVITVLELEIGVRLMERRDKRQGAALRNWLDNKVTTSFRDRVLPFDEAAARYCAGLHVPRDRSDRDSFIGSIAAVNGLTVVTRNVKDFHGMGVELVNPWEVR